MSLVAGIIGTVVLAACGSGSDEAAATVASSSPATDTVASEPGSTVPATTTPPTTVPASTLPATTTPPATVPATTAPPSTSIVADGVVTDLGGSRFDGVAATDGRTPFISVKQFTGDLVGEARVVGSFLVGDESVDATARWDFTGELVGVGDGTFLLTNSSTMDKSGERFESTGDIVGLTGAFEGLTGTLVLAGTDFGAEADYRIELVPLADGVPPEDPLTVEFVAAVADEFAIAFTEREFSRIEQRLGDEGTWVAIDGTVFDRSTVADFFGVFGFITSIVRTDEYIEAPDAIAFQMSETFDGGAEGTFWLAVSRDDSGVLTITEYKQAPEW